MKTSTLIVGFTGYAKAGKDTAAQAIQGILESIGVRVDKLAFADPIRQIGDLFGYTYEQMSDQKLKETYTGNKITNVTPRKFMQLVGSEMFRNSLDKDIWVRLLESKMEEFTPEPSPEEKNDDDSGSWRPRQIFLITDVRFANEAAMIKKHNGLIIKIERTNMISNGEWRNHESEKHIDELVKDMTWYNNVGSAVEWSGEAVRLFGSMCSEKKISLSI